MPESRPAEDTLTGAFNESTNLATFAGTAILAASFLLSQPMLNEELNGWHISLVLLLAGSLLLLSAAIHLSGIAVVSFYRNHVGSQFKDIETHRIIQKIDGGISVTAFVSFCLGALFFLLGAVMLLLKLLIFVK